MWQRLGGEQGRRGMLAAVLPQAGSRGGCLQSCQAAGILAGLQVLLDKRGSGTGCAVAVLFSRSTIWFSACTSWNAWTYYHSRRVHCRLINSKL